MYQWQWKILNNLNWYNFVRKCREFVSFDDDDFITISFSQWESEDLFFENCQNSNARKSVKKCSSQLDQFLKIKVYNDFFKLAVQFLSSSFYWILRLDDKNLRNSEIFSNFQISNLQIHRGFSDEENFPVFRETGLWIY